MTTQTKKYITYTGVGIVAFLLIRTLFAKKDTFLPDPTGNDSITIPGAGSNAIPFNAKRVADILYDAMKETGTDEDAIFDVLKNVNEPQFVLVVNAFGRKSYNETLGNQVNPLAWVTNLPLKDLPFWLKNELDTQRYNTLRLKYPNLL